MARLTKRSYNRRLVMLGVMLFIGIGLISTGFAAWVMSTDTSADGQGNVTGAVVADSSLELTLENATNLGTFSFDAKKDDVTGRLRSDGENFESLSVTLKGSVHPNTYLKHLNIKITLPKGVKDAIAAGYLVLTNEGLEEGVDIISQLSKSGTTSNFTYEIKFAWGSKFNGKNPCEYYDEDPLGLAVSDADMKKEIRAFRTMLNEGKETPDDLLIELHFDVLVEAKAND